MTKLNSPGPGRNPVQLTDARYIEAKNANEFNDTQLEWPNP